uniref:Alpha 1,4-glycosyltransferase domain-containing protein n=1 Tax=viral metagenome TaxID=1070528 RepID=A0A6C0CS33_9ZZZZ
MTIPNIVHFIFGFKEQTTPFPFMFYVAIWSAHSVNHPERILLHYHHMPYGPWFEKVKELCELCYVEHVPDYIGTKPIVQTAHAADIYRLQMLKQHGGIYLDIDTICVRSWSHLLQYACVLGEERAHDKLYGLSNAILFSEPNGAFVNIWLQNYASYFQSSGWGEASIQMPLQIAHLFPDYCHVLSNKAFCYPSWEMCEKIFQTVDNVDDPDPDLITLHLWNTNTVSKEHIESIITDWTWVTDHPLTLYARLIQKILNTK